MLLHLKPRSMMPVRVHSTVHRHTSAVHRHIRSQFHSGSIGRLFNGISPYYSNCVFDLRPGADYTSMPDVALYLSFIARWLQNRTIRSGPPTPEEIEYGRRYLDMEMANDRGIFAEPPKSRYQLVPTKYLPPPDSDKPVWSMIVEDKGLQERIRDKDDDISLGYYIDDKCRLVRDGYGEAPVKTNIRIPFPHIMKDPTSDDHLYSAISIMYDSKVNPCWRCLESLDWDFNWRNYAEWMEDIFIFNRFGQKAVGEERVVTENLTSTPVRTTLTQEYDHPARP